MAAQKALPAPKGVWKSALKLAPTAEMAVLIAKVNSQKFGWRARKNSKFEGMTFAQARQLMGSKGKLGVLPAKTDIKVDASSFKQFRLADRVPELCLGD